MDPTNEPPPGPLAGDKIEDGPTPPGQPDIQPQAAEVESARMLANEARGALQAAGLTDGEITRLADEYIALDMGEDVTEFTSWARARPRVPSS